ncbi:cell cycle checkpoint control protein RAD9A [Apostasia shenzhenica]|uniref:Cell cycle checkpoint control protein RAD9A n=1 Tax=Apostasia shenzhenica TaxID=1088818 RepID=A0A2I0AQ52_9ASPA|nr:cell cycle checkpoint control protein RAD9A [Apostasia shenzhenica]
MELSLSGNSLKALHRSVTCLARIGSELVLQASSSQLVFHTLNSSRSAYQSITFKPDFFDSYTILSSTSPEVRCSLLVKSVCSIFRTPVSSIALLCVRLPSPHDDKLQWTLHCQSGVRKTYWISCNVEPEIQHLSIDKRRFPSSFVVRPRDLTRLLANFQSSLQEITIIATEPSTLSCDNDGEIGGKAVELRSYIDPAKDNSDATLHTQLWIDPAEEFLQYQHVGDPVDVTFGVKELKYYGIVILPCYLIVIDFLATICTVFAGIIDSGCPFSSNNRLSLLIVKDVKSTSTCSSKELATSDFSFPTVATEPSLISSLHYSVTGIGVGVTRWPILMAPRFGFDGGSFSEFDATLVLATMLISQLNRPDPSDQLPAVPEAQGNDSRRSAAGPSPVSDNPSDHTKIWSNLSGSADRCSEDTRDRQVPVEENANIHIERPAMETETNALLRRETHYSIDPHGGRDTTGNPYTQHHPSNWVGAGDDGDDGDDDEDEFYVQSTP